MFLDQHSEAPVQLSEHAENALFAIAESLGLLATQEEAAALDKLAESTDEALTEAANVVRLNRDAKLESLTVRSALVIAQQRKDPLFTKYAKAAELKRRLRAIIVKKYGSQAGTSARKLLANAGKRNMVDISQKPSSLSNPATRRA